VTGTFYTLPFTNSAANKLLTYLAVP
jgi:hypothetical protein